MNNAPTITKEPLTPELPVRVWTVKSVTRSGRLTEKTRPHWLEGEALKDAFNRVTLGHTEIKLMGLAVAAVPSEWGIGGAK